MSNITTVQRTHTFGHAVTLIVWECPMCGIVYGIPKSFADDCRANGERYYCPNGHLLGWDKTDADRERERAEQLARRLRSAEDTARRWRDYADAERRSAAAYKGHLTRMRNRIARGVCPQAGCKRSFTQLHEHIATCHPELLDKLGIEEA